MKLNSDDDERKKVSQVLDKNSQGLNETKFWWWWTKKVSKILNENVSRGLKLRNWAGGNFPKRMQRKIMNKAGKSWIKLEKKIYKDATKTHECNRKSWIKLKNKIDKGATKNHE